MSRSEAPLLSLIVPHRNHQRYLPTLLDSVLAQSLRSLEVIIVDDASDASCEDIIQAYAGKGLDIRLLQNPVQIFKLHARLRGIEAAKAQIIAFADADDLLWETTALEEHVNLLLRENADIVHFGSVLVSDTGNFKDEFPWALPFADHCEGEDIFARFTATHPMGWAIWNKLYRKSLCMLCRDDFERSVIGRYAEDLYMNAHFMFHAKSYVGSKRIGYGYQHVDKRDTISLPRILALYAMNKELLPLFREKGAKESSLADLSRAFWQHLRIDAGRLCISLVERHGDPLSDAALADLLRHADAETWLRILITTNKLNAEKLQQVARAVLQG